MLSNDGNNSIEIDNWVISLISPFTQHKCSNRKSGYCRVNDECTALVCGKCEEHTSEFVFAVWNLLRGRV